MSDVQFDDNGDVITGTDVEVVGATPAGVAGLAALPAEVHDFLTNAKQAVGVSDEDAELAIIADILRSDTVEDILAQPDVVHIGDLVGEEMTIVSWRWNKSSIGGSIGFYMMLTVTIEGHDKPILVSCGSKACMAQVYAMATHNFLPVKVLVHKADKPTANGFFPLRLLTPERQF